MNENKSTLENNFIEQSKTNFFDEPLEETDLSKLIGFDDCKNCFFRTFFLKHVTQGVLQLRRRKY